MEQGPVARGDVVGVAAVGAVGAAQRWRCAERRGAPCPAGRATAIFTASVLCLLGMHCTVSALRAGLRAARRAAHRAALAALTTAHILTLANQALTFILIQRVIPNNSSPAAAANKHRNLMGAAASGQWDWFYLLLVYRVMCNHVVILHAVSAGKLGPMAGGGGTVRHLLVWVMVASCAGTAGISLWIYSSTGGFSPALLSLTALYYLSTEPSLLAMYREAVWSRCECHALEGLEPALTTVACRSGSIIFSLLLLATRLRAGAAVAVLETAGALAVLVLAPYWALCRDACGAVTERARVAVTTRCRLATAQHLATYDDVCAICRQPMSAAASSQARVAPCRHTFHGKCLIAALRHSRVHRCPLCLLSL